MPTVPDSVDTYIYGLSEPGATMARQIREIVHRAAPGCTEAIRYGMPAFRIGGKSFLFFGVWKKHVGVYPVYHGDAAFEAMVAPYRARKDTVQFPLRDPLPPEVIAAIARAQFAAI